MAEGARRNRSGWTTIQGRPHAQACKDKIRSAAAKPER